MKYLNEVLVAICAVACFIGVLISPFKYQLVFMYGCGWFVNEFVSLLKIRKIHRTYEHLMDFKELEEEFMKKMFETEGEVQEISEDGNGAPNFVSEPNKKNRN